MKKVMMIILIPAMLLFTSCATILGGKVTDQQRTKPDVAKHEPSRQVRVGYLIADLLLFWPGTFVDFATNAIYKPR